MCVYLIKTAQAKCNLFKGSLSYLGVIVWNSIPVTIKDSSSLPMFIMYQMDFTLIDTLLKYTSAAICLIMKY